MVGEQFHSNELSAMPVTVRATSPFRPRKKERNMKEEIYKQKDIDSLLNGSVIRICNLRQNLSENLTKHKAILLLGRCDYKTSPKEISYLLEVIFGIWNEMPNHWLWVAQFYTPKAIRSVLNEMRKRKENGAMPLETPGAYFTKVLTCYHPRRKIHRRKEFTATNGGRKQQRNGGEF